VRLYTHSLMTRKPIYTVIACQPLLCNLSDASQSSVTGCLSTVSSSTWTRLSCCELDHGPLDSLSRGPWLDRGTISLSQGRCLSVLYISVLMTRPCSYVDSDIFIHPTLFSIDTSRFLVRPVSTGCRYAHVTTHQLLWTYTI